jgi:hypothetical protein
MPPRGKESIIRRQKEIARQQKQKEKQARRNERRSQSAGGGSGAGEISPDDLVSVEDLIGPTEPGAGSETEPSDDEA